MRDIFIPDSLGKLALRLTREESTSALPDASPSPPACERHPDWKPTRRGPQPSHVEGLCPGCRRDAEHKEKALPVYIGGGLPDVEPSPEHARRLQRLETAYEEHLERSETVRPGSVEEVDALERIDQLRDDEQRRDSAKYGRGGVLVSGRIEGSRWVEYRAIPTGRKHRTRIIRVPS